MSKKKERIVVAMSGGVDSSVVTALLAHQGYDVIGITLRLWTPSPWTKGERVGGCCSPQDISEAKEVCRQLKVPHYTYNMEERFKERVVDDFISEYMEGRTPNPCVQCNSFIKFDVLLKYAIALEADYLATGHYARISRDPDSDTYRLYKAVDPTKDQSYFLYMLNQSHLKKVLFPLGGMTKPQVRELAEKYGLVTAKKADSQDVCFLEGRNYREFLSERVDLKEIKKGPIKTKDGRVIGEHQGLPFYTIGQREKLGIAMGERYYVVDKDIQSDTLVVGKVQETLRAKASLKTLNWCDSKNHSSDTKAKVKIRYRHPGSSATIREAGPGEAVVTFDEPQSSISRGQSAVFYNGDEVLGGGVIKDVFEEETP